MKALRVLRNLQSFTLQPQKTQFNPSFLCQFFSSQTVLDHPTASTTTSSSSGNEDDIESPDFDSAHFALPLQNPQQVSKVGPNWDERYRERVRKKVFGEETGKGCVREVKDEEETEQEVRRRALARALLQAALEGPDEEEEEDEDLVVNVEDQKSLSVGIIGAPNAGKSALTNYMVRTLQLGPLF